MIGKLKGIIDDVFPNSIILDVNGVGYKVEGIIGAKLGENITLYIYTHVREQELRLFGFRTRDELNMFEKLLDVQGIGPKLAVKLINQVSLQDIVSAVASEDSQMLRIPGLGEKLAKKIIIDLKNKIDKADLSSISSVLPGKDMADVVEALLSLGFKKEKIEAVLRHIEAEGKSQKEVIREALSLINKPGN